ncbi:ThiS adenylyltransferase [Campylobacter blaseri]|uniref:Thiamine biosynthesis protein ThiF n=1 Tax=Campylobacter blaseri TaxID=2042961 RepID=A0A2P8QZ32_9BACT|nr:sulfur carrier protein ThiS adenylyltransferase ThiF [Campylobacter blaseri]PSM51499.1 thiamine biosynthesis protein ThiF [Campylobacter blaseri]PSM52948.1 thiamine biosynthesis protein ThiF [Campylobacter blaseri]QKF86490.1 ThiS adenylyltransferase [Campylobacter blaseri]
MKDSLNSSNADNFKSEIKKRNSPLVNEKVKTAKVAILGLGGLGSNVSVMLTRLGVGSLVLVDFDRVEISNLNRQNYNKTHIGALKTEALSRQLKDINPFLEIKTLNLKLNSENLEQILKDETIICEAFDNANLKAILMQYAQKNPNKFFVFGNGMGGFESGNLMKTTKFGKNCYICGDFKSDFKNGIMAPRVMICAALQANVILRLILEEFEA